MRRLVSITLAAILLATPVAAMAQAYPNKAIRLIVPFAAGAGTDVIARTVMQRAGEILGQPMLIENRAGAGGNIGAEAGAKAAADGYTITILSTIHAANQSFYRKLGYSMEGDFVPVVEIGVSPTLWVVRADLPVRTLQELAQLARSSAGKLTYGSGGASHPVELFKALTGSDIIVVPYKGVAAVMQDLVAGRVDMSVAGFLDTDAHIRSGKLRALATTNSERLSQLPDVPAMREFLPGYDFTLWYGIFVPRETPAAAIAALRSSVLRALESPEVIARLQALAIRPAKSSTEGFAARVQAEVARWADTVKKAKIELQD